MIIVYQRIVSKYWSTKKIITSKLNVQWLSKFKIVETSTIATTSFDNKVTQSNEILEGLDISSNITVVNYETINLIRYFLSFISL